MIVTRFVLFLISVVLNLPVMNAGYYVDNRLGVIKKLLATTTAAEDSAGEKAEKADSNVEAEAKDEPKVVTIGSSAEVAGGFTPAWKRLVDWIKTIEVINAKTDTSDPRVIYDATVDRYEILEPFSFLIRPMKVVMTSNLSHLDQKDLLAKADVPGSAGSVMTPDEFKAFQEWMLNQINRRYQGGATYVSVKHEVEVLTESTYKFTPCMVGDDRLAYAECDAPVLFMLNGNPALVNEALRTNRSYLSELQKLYSVGAALRQEAVKRATAAAV